MFPGIKNLDKWELAVVKWQYGWLGSFDTALWQAISTADEEHLTRLSAGFPVEIEAYCRYTRESGWWAKVQDKLLKH